MLLAVSFGGVESISEVDASHGSVGRLVFTHSKANAGVDGLKDVCSLNSVWLPIANNESQDDSFSSEVLNILADLTTELVRYPQPTPPQIWSFETMTFALVHVSIPSASTRDFRAVFRHICGHAVGMHIIMAFLG